MYRIAILRFDFGGIVRRLLPVGGRTFQMRDQARLRLTPLSLPMRSVRTSCVGRKTASLQRQTARRFRGCFRTRCSVLLKLAFTDKLAYCRNEGFRTPQVAVPFRILGNFAQKDKLAERKGFEPSIPFNGYTPLAGERLQPLGHLSGGAENVGIQRRMQGKTRPGGASFREFYEFDEFHGFCASQADPPPISSASAPALRSAAVASSLAVRAI